MRGLLFVLVVSILPVMAYGQSSLLCTPSGPRLTAEQMQQFLVGKTITGVTRRGGGWTLNLDPGVTAGRSEFRNDRGQAFDGAWKIDRSRLCQSYNDGDSWICHEIRACGDDRAAAVMINAQGVQSSLLTRVQDRWPRQAKGRLCARPGEPLRTDQLDRLLPNSRLRMRSANGTAATFLLGQNGFGEFVDPSGRSGDVDWRIEGSNLCVATWRGNETCEKFVRCTSDEGRFVTIDRAGRQTTLVTEVLAPDGRERVVEPVEPPALTVDLSGVGPAVYAALMRSQGASAERVRLRPRGTDKVKQDIIARRAERRIGQLVREFSGRPVVVKSPRMPISIKGYQDRERRAGVCLPGAIWIKALQQPGVEARERHQLFGFTLANNAVAQERGGDGNKIQQRCPGRKTAADPSGGAMQPWVGEVPFKTTYPFYAYLRADLDVQERLMQAEKAGELSAQYTCRLAPSRAERKWQLRSKREDVGDTPRFAANCIIDQIDLFGGLPAEGREQRVTYRFEGTDQVSATSQLLPWSPGSERPVRVTVPTGPTRDQIRLEFAYADAVCKAEDRRPLEDRRAFCFVTSEDQRLKDVFAPLDLQAGRDINRLSPDLPPDAIVPAGTRVIFREH